MQGAGAGKVASGEPTKIQIFKFKFKSFLVSQVVSLILHSRKSRNHFPPKCDFWRRTERLLMTINPDWYAVASLLQPTIRSERIPPSKAGLPWPQQATTHKTMTNDRP